MSAFSLARCAPALSLFNSLLKTSTHVSGAGYHMLTVTWRRLDNKVPSTHVDTSVITPCLLPTSPVLYTPCAGFKVMGKPRKRCKNCYFTMIDDRLHVLCTTHPRHKQKAQVKRFTNSCILTHATQGKIRPW